MSDYRAEYPETDRPFSFADLKGSPEPTRWGPKYSKPVKTPAWVIRDIPTNCASGQKYDYSAEKHRQKLRNELIAAAAADKRNWALGKRCGLWQNTIVEAYESVMRARRAALAAIENEFFK